MKRSTWNIGGGWSKSGGLYRHNGKFVSADKFNRAYQYRVEKRAEEKQRVERNAKQRERYAAKKKTRSTKRKLNPGRFGDFCRLKNRKQFYDQVKKDLVEFTKKMGIEKGKALQLEFTIGDGDVRRKKIDKRRKYTHGKRVFTDLRKVRTFLNFHDREKYSTADGRVVTLPKWRKKGKESVCTFQKTAHLVLPNVNPAKRKQTLKTYEIES